MTDKLAILVPGLATDYISKHIPDVIMDKIASKFGIEDGHNEWIYDIEKEISENTDYETIVHDWDGGLTRKYGIEPEAKKLSDLINENSDKEVVLLCKSLGGVIGELALKEEEHKNVKKMMYIATPHRGSKHELSEDIEVLNVYSDADHYRDFANVVLNQGRGSKCLKDKNTDNIQIENVKHSEFNHNVDVIYKGKERNLYDVYIELLT